MFFYLADLAALEIFAFKHKQMKKIVNDRKVFGCRMQTNNRMARSTVFAMSFFLLFPKS